MHLNLFSVFIRSSGYTKKWCKIISSNFSRWTSTSWGWALCEENGYVCGILVAENICTNLLLDKAFICHCSSGHAVYVYGVLEWSAGEVASLGFEDAWGYSIWDHAYGLCRCYAICWYYNSDKMPLQERRVTHCLCCCMHAGVLNWSIHKQLVLFVLENCIKQIRSWLHHASSWLLSRTHALKVWLM